MAGDFESDAAERQDDPVSSGKRALVRGSGYI
jgi:hypothetical protein